MASIPLRSRPSSFVLTAHAGTWGPSPVTLHYQWNADDVPIGGATAVSYTVSPADLGKRITGIVTGTKTGNLTVVTNSVVTPVDQ